MAALTTMVQMQERYRSNHATYAADPATLGVTDDKMAALTKYYTVSFADLGDTPAFSTGYVITAAAIGPQSGDANCAQLIVKLQASLFKYQSAKADGTDTSDDPSKPSNPASPHCWAR